MLQSIAEVRRRIEAGEAMILAGSEGALAQLPRGRWIAGTIPYFMDRRGGVYNTTDVFVSPVPACAAEIRICKYTEQSIPSICRDAPENGYSVLILPAGSDVHTTYAQTATGFEGAIIKPVVGWVAGVGLSQLDIVRPRVFHGPSMASTGHGAVVMHVELPAGTTARIETINVFKPNAGPTITFPLSSFEASECLIDGQMANLAKYILDQGIDIRLPLVCDDCEEPVNVSIQHIDREWGVVSFYAPVFAGTHYKFAVPVPDYLGAFESAVAGLDGSDVFSCNCILNYLYAELEGKQTSRFTGPITFGEIANQLLNQTFVRLSLQTK